MNTALKWITAVLIAGLAWRVMQSQAEYRWAHQRIPMKHRHG